MLISVNCIYYIFDCNTNVIKGKLRDVETLDTWLYDNYLALSPEKFRVKSAS